MSLEVGAFPETEGFNVRRRRAGRAYAISYFTEAWTRSSHTKLTQLHEVVCYNIWVDLIGFHIGNATVDQFRNSKRYPYFASRMRSSLTDELIKISEDLGDAIYDLKANQRIMVVVQTMSYEDSVAYLDANDSSRFYRDTMNNQMCFIEDLRKLSRFSEADLGREVVNTRLSCKTQFMMTSSGLSFSGEGPSPYDHFTTLNENRLIFFLKIIRKLKASIAIAASNSLLPKDLLERIRMRLREFDQRSLYSLACSTVLWDSPKESSLITDSETWWSTTPDGRHITMASDKVALAYDSSGNTRSILTFIVPTVSLAAVLPAAIAWRQGGSASGTTHDSDFWQAIASSIMQLLGLITFIWPTLGHPRLLPLTWVWIWMLAAFSAVCAILSVPLYVSISGTWSFAVSFAGVLAQAVVQLQVVNAI